MQFSEASFQLRTKETHSAHCEGLGGVLHDHIATTYGLVRDSILNSTKYFHIVDGLVPDIMHDLLEGSLALCTKLLLQHFIQTKCFSVELLNQRISSFSYGHCDAKNKPSAIQHHVVSSTDSKLGQSGTFTCIICKYL